MKEILDTLKYMNDQMRTFGFNTNISLKSDFIEITESEVIVDMPYNLKVTIPRSSFDGSQEEIKSAISQAISRSVSLNK